MKMKDKKTGRLLTALFSAGMIGLCGLAMADEGIVRISDSAISGEPQLFPVNGAVTYYEGNSAGTGYGFSSCPHCNQGNGCQNGCPKEGCFNKYPADAGWGRPVRNPINRIPVTYLKRWPNSVHGISGRGPAPRFPMVYQPTDTTQLGFTYQSVPAWQPNPSMLPPMPWPNQWHQRECGYRGCNTPGCEGCQGGAIYGEVIYEGTTTPAEQPRIKSEPTEVPPVPEANLRAPTRLRKLAVR